MPDLRASDGMKADDFSTTESGSADLHQSDLALSSGCAKVRADPPAHPFAN